MNSNFDKNNFILARSQEHKLILESLGEVESCLKFSSADELIGKLKPVMQNFKSSVLKHQMLEEKVIFSAGLRSIPTESVVNLILQLSKEHGIFEAAIDSIIDKLNFPGDPTRTRLLIENEVKKIVTVLKKHSLLEVKELFPLLAANPACRTMIDNLANKTQI